MGNTFSDEKFIGSDISEALIDGQVEDIAEIIQNPNNDPKLDKKKEILNDLLYKKDENGRTVLHLVTIFIIQKYSLIIKSKTSK